MSNKNQYCTVHCTVPGTGTQESTHSKFGGAPTPYTGGGAKETGRQVEDILREM